MFTNEKVASVTAIDYFYDEKENNVYLCIGDEMGVVRIVHFGKIIKDMGLKPTNMQAENKKRNPWRILETNAADVIKKPGETKKSDSDDDASGDSDSEKPKTIEGIPLYEDVYVPQIKQWAAHTDTIKSLIVIKESDERFIFTAGLDKMAKLWV